MANYTFDARGIGHRQGYDSSRPSPTSRSYKPGEFPIMEGRLPEVFGSGYLGRPYDIATMIDAEAKIKGYRIPERISLPYLGSPESQTNKTSL